MRWREWTGGGLERTVGGGGDWQLGGELAGEGWNWQVGDGNGLGEKERVFGFAGKPTGSGNLVWFLDFVVLQVVQRQQENRHG